jgi:hypothetical protein
MKKPVTQERVEDLARARHVSTVQFPAKFLFEIPVVFKHPPFHMNYAFPGAIELA